MKILNFSALILFPFISINIKTSYTVKPTTVATSNHYSDVIGTGQKLWVLHSINSSLKNLENHNIYQEVVSLTRDTLIILNDTSEKVLLKKNLEKIDKKIGEIEYYYNDMVHYYSTYKNITSITRMFNMSYNVIRYGVHGPLRSLNETLDLLAFGSLNIIDKLKEISQVCKILSFVAQ